MLRRPRIATLTDTLFPFATLLRSQGHPAPAEWSASDRSWHRESPTIYRERTRPVAQLPCRAACLPAKPCASPLRPAPPPYSSVLHCVIAGEPIEICGLERSEEHTSELQSLMRISYAVFFLKKNTTQ